MTWFLLALVAAIFSAFWSISIKLSNNYFNSESTMTVMGIVNFLLNLLLFIYKKKEFHFSKYSIISGIFLMLVLYFFSKALVKVDNPGVPAALLRFQVVITFFLSLYFLNSKFEYLKLFFIILLIIGIFLILFGKKTAKKEKKKNNNVYLLYILGSIISFSIYDIVVKKGVVEAGLYSNALVMSGISAILFLIIQYTTSKKIGLQHIKDKNNTIISIFDKNNYLIPISAGVLLFFQQLFLIESIRLSSNPAYPKAILASQILIVTIVSQFIFKNAKIATTQIIGMLIVLGAVMGMTFE